ncbi:MAG: hypothetical protein CSA85_00235 [Alphaproteobacteria bacterium]|nr:MAG: hypothetical protein CSA85_00235 [Alphaproteobacteria bacterium]
MNINVQIAPTGAPSTWICCAHNGGRALLVQEQKFARVTLRAKATSPICRLGPDLNNLLKYHTRTGAF